MRRIAALLLVFAPLAVFAETPPPEVSVAHDEPAPATSVAQPAPAAPVGAPIAAPVIPAATPVIAAVAQAPRWSIGAGVGFNSSGMFLSSASVFSLWWPAATASVERAVGDRTWLTVGASGSFDREETKASDSILSTIPRRDTGQLVLTAGVRRPVSRPGAPVEVSALVLAEGGALRFRSGTSSSTDVEQRAWLVGASAGIAVERALAAGLALRISTGILGVRYWRGKRAYAGGPSVTTSDLSAQLRLSPSIELRLAF